MPIRQKCGKNLIRDILTRSYALRSKFILSRKWLSEAKLKARSEALRQNKLNSGYFDAKLRFVLSASFYSASFSEKKWTINWPVDPQGLI